MIGAGTLQYVGSRQWRLSPHPLYQNQSLEINWLDFLPSPSGETKHQRNYIVKSSKELLLLMISDAEIRYGKLSPGTVFHWFEKIKLLVIWMIEKNKWRFSTLTSSDIYSFIEYRIQLGAKTRRADGKMAMQTINDYITLVDRMWRMRNRYTASLAEYPGTTSLRKKFAIMAREDGSFKPISLIDAVALLKVCLEWQAKYRPILEVAEELWIERRKRVGLSKKQIDIQRAKAFSNVEESDNGRYIKSLDQDYPRPFSSLYSEVVNSAIAASLLTILFFTGMRIAEVLTLKVNCLSQKLHQDGKQYWYISGTACKKNGAGRSWIAGEPAVHAIHFLEALYLPLSSTLTSFPLFPARIGNGFLPSNRRAFAALNSPGGNRLMRRFIAKYVNVPEENISKTFHAHRARKTFARFIAIRDKKSLESLAHHYGHLYVGVLDRAYVGNDFDLDELLREEKQRELRSGLTELLSSDTLGGKAGEKLAAFKSRKIEAREFIGKTGVERMVDHLIEEGLVLAPCDWGFCVYVKDLSKCGGTDLAPNDAGRSPSICASCSNFAVTDAHLPWWERRAIDQEAFLERDNLLDQARRVVEHQLSQTKKILTELVHAKRPKKTKFDDII